MSSGSSQSDPAVQSAQSASVLEQLACPVCLARLRLEASRLVCTGCRRIYPIVDGIPILIAERPDAGTLE